jgi:peptidoglycan-N-acetylglucosamine deacetylase
MLGPIVRAGALVAAAALLVSAQDGFRWPNGARAAVALTYDDGIDAHLDNAMPDLEARNLRGSFYVPGNSRSLANRMGEWRAAARRGHELGNHSVFHPCLRVDARGCERAFVTPERNLDNYTMRRISDELAANNTLLQAVDGKRVRTYAYTCCDITAGGASYVDALRPLFPAARGGEYEGLVVGDLRALDLHNVTSWMVAKVSGEAMIAFVKKAVDGGGLAVVMFHGVGGGHGINVDREAHQKLLAWLDENRKLVWTDTFLNVTQHIAAERQRLGWRNPRP